MKKIDKLREKARLAERNIEDLKAEMFLAENAVIENPNNSEAAIKATAATMQVSAAEKAYERALEAIQAEEKRLNSKEYKDAQKRLAELEKQAAEIQQANIEWAREFFPQFEEWVALIQEHQRLAREWEIEVLDVWNRDMSEAGMRSIKDALNSWDAQRKLIDYRERHPIGQ